MRIRKLLTLAEILYKYKFNFSHESDIDICYKCKQGKMTLNRPYDFLIADS